MLTQNISSAIKNEKNNDINSRFTSFFYFIGCIAGIGIVSTTGVGAMVVLLSGAVPMTLSIGSEVIASNKYLNFLRSNKKSGGYTLVESNPDNLNKLSISDSPVNPDTTIDKYGITNPEPLINFINYHTNGLDVTDETAQDLIFPWLYALVLPGLDIFPEDDDSTGGSKSLQKK